NIIVVNSLAKGFGIPIAILAGEKEFVDYFKKRSLSRIHCSPPSIAHISAIENALKLNSIKGDDIREKLANKVIFFKKNISRLGLNTWDSFFPIQPVFLPQDMDVFNIYNYLLRCGIKTLLTNIESQKRPQITFFIRGDHSFGELISCINFLDSVLLKESFK
ncbi:MAG: aminotransferase class I/II-fold pyridoxal phosphate-dependent enzyme, partial [Chitinispirillaceae bacterium]|nr:aminotransferase class I/II-fold pyridoxal phosphate-dependent enzyme [Chitinispirillaceae bacterium]